MSADTIQPGAEREVLDPTDAGTLLETARLAIVSQLEDDLEAAPEAVASSSPLAAVRASFVTLRIHGALRGCIGSLEASDPLLLSVWHNARRAAFRDPRFSPLGSEELPDLEIHVSVLSPLEPMRTPSEADLLAQLRPGVDGLVIQDGPHRATFLPDVWESLSEPDRFLHELKRKAGLSADHWSDDLLAWRYETHGYDEQP